MSRLGSASCHHPLQGRCLLAVSPPRTSIPAWLPSAFLLSISSSHWTPPLGLPLSCFLHLASQLPFGQPTQREEMPAFSVSSRFANLRKKFQEPAKLTLLSVSSRETRPFWARLVIGALVS